MGWETEALGLMRKAVAEEDVGEALRWLGQTGARDSRDSYISPYDLLDLIRLMARVGDPRFAAFADRWLERFVIRAGASLPQRQVAHSAIGALAMDPDDEAVIEALRAVTPAPGSGQNVAELRAAIPKPRVDFHDGA